MRCCGEGRNRGCVPVRVVRRVHGDANPVALAEPHDQGLHHQGVRLRHGDQRGSAHRAGHAGHEHREQRHRDADGQADADHRRQAGREPKLRAGRRHHQPWHRWCGSVRRVRNPGYQHHVSIMVRRLHTVAVDGKYAVYYAKAINTNVTGNTLYGHELEGDDAAIIEDGENPLEAAKRELCEETGYTTNDVFLLDEAYISPTTENSKNYIVVAYNCEKTSEPKTDGTELVTYGLFKEEELKYIVDRNIMNGAMNKLAYYNYINNVDGNGYTIDSNSTTCNYLRKKKMVNPLEKWR